MVLAHPFVIVELALGSVTVWLSRCPAEPRAGHMAKSLSNRIPIEAVPFAIEYS
jgi:hypothetical protein